MTIVKTQVRNRRIEVPAPNGIPDGREVTLTIVENDDRAPLPPEEISRILAAMKKMAPWDIPANVSADLDAWEKKINQRGLEHRDPSSEGAFR